MTKYDRGYCDQLKTHCENGKSLESFCAVIGVSPKLISEWYNEYSDFKEAVDMAPCLELFHWEARMIRALQNNMKEEIMVSKSRIDALSKYVISPLKKNTFKTLKENAANPNSSNADLIDDYKQLFDKRKKKK